MALDISAYLIEEELQQKEFLGFLLVHIGVLAQT